MNPQVIFSVLDTVEAAVSRPSHVYGEHLC